MELAALQKEAKRERAVGPEERLCEDPARREHLQVGKRAPAWVSESEYFVRGAGTNQGSTFIYRCLYSDVLKTWFE